MAKKLFLLRERAIATARAPSVNSGSSESIIASTSRYSLVFDTTLQLPFKVLDETSKSLPKFIATGRSMLIKFNTPG
jgi:hypothetical protein